MTIKVFDRTLEALSKSLDMRTQRQVLISSNIANAETPGYQAQTLDFEKALAYALNTETGTHSPESNSIEEIGEVRPEIYNSINNVVREDGNTVDRDQEMTSMAENELLYNAAVDLMKKKLALLKYSIADGGGH